MKNYLIIIASAILVFSLNACGPDISGDTTTINATDSYNIDNSTNTDSFNTYTAEQETILGDGYIPDEAGVCRADYFWCSIEERCLPSSEGASCPLAHTDEDEAEASEINENI